AGTFLICAAVFACAAGLSLWQAERINAKIENVFDGTTFRLYHTMLLNDHVESYVGALGGFLLSGSADLYITMTETKAEAEATIEMLASRFAEATDGEIRGPWTQLTGLVDRALELHRLGDQAAAVATYQEAERIARTFSAGNLRAVEA